MGKKMEVEEVWQGFNMRGGGYQHTHTHAKAASVCVCVSSNGWLHFLSFCSLWSSNRSDIFKDFSSFNREMAAASAVMPSLPCLTDGHASLPRRPGQSEASPDEWAARFISRNSERSQNLSANHKCVSRLNHWHFAGSHQIQDGLKNNNNFTVNARYMLFLKFSQFRFSALLNFCCRS